MSLARFQQVLTEAVADLTAHGYDSPARLDRWLTLIRAAAQQAMIPDEQLERTLRDSLLSIYKRLVDREGLFSRHNGASRFTIAQVKPKLRAELDRRILASANLIKLNRRRVVEQTLQRFSGWATSIPAGGSKTVKRAETKNDIRKSLASLPFEERRVAIDQGHKLNSALSEIVAQGGGAIAGKWQSHWRQVGYNFRPDHKERDEKVYLIRNSWAHEAGLVKPGPAGYSDDVTKPGEEVFCRCFYQYIYNVRDLPADMLTAKGRAALQHVRVGA